MRVSVVLALAAATLVVVGPASAMPVDAPPGAGKARLTCFAGLVGAEAGGRVRYDSFKNGKVTDSVRSKGEVGFPVTAWGYYDSKVTKAGGRVLQLDAIAENGVPRQVTITQAKSGKVTDIRSTALRQTGFEPDLFTEGYGFYAYTIDRGVLKQWTLTRLRSGGLKYTDPVKIGRGYADVTSLVVTNIFEEKGVRKEVAFATTADGALLELTIPQKKPRKTTVKQLADTGYAGVTEMVWSICDNDGQHIYLAAFDPVADVATWTTVKNVLGRPKATLHGEITGGRGWDLTAAY